MVNNPVFSEDLRQLIKAGNVMTGLEDILESVEKIFVVLDANLRVLYANPYAMDVGERLSDKNLVKGDQLLDILNNEARLNFTPKLNSTLKGIEESGILKCEGMNGQCLYFKYTISPIYTHGRVNALLVEAKDYSNQIFVEQHIKTGNNLMDVIFKTVESSIIILDETAKVVRINEALKISVALLKTNCWAFPFLT